MDKPYKILIIDDDELFRESNQELLSAFGYEVITAGDGNEGIAMAKKNLPDIIILDVMMAYDTEGFDTARKIRLTQELAQCRIILVSGIVHEKKLNAFPLPDPNWLPVDRILEKPIDPPRLLAEIERVLNK